MVKPGFSSTAPLLGSDNKDRSGNYSVRDEVGSGADGESAGECVGEKYIRIWDGKEKEQQGQEKHGSGMGEEEARTRSRAASSSEMVDENAQEEAVMTKLETLLNDTDRRRRKCATSFLAVQAAIFLVTLSFTGAGISVFGGIMVWHMKTGGVLAYCVMQVSSHPRPASKPLLNYINLIPTGTALASLKLQPSLPTAGFSSHCNSILPLISSLVLFC